MPCCFSSCQPAFALAEEGECDDNDNNKNVEASVAIVLDVRRTFAPEPAWAVNSTKALLFVVSFGWMIYNAFSTEEMDGSPKDAFYLVYLTNWATILASAYLLCSLLSSLLRNHETWAILRQPASLEEPPSRLVRITWFLAPLAYHLEVVITVLYWGFVYPHDNFRAERAFMSHGIVMLLVGFDVVFINNTPIRFAQLKNTMILGIVFIAWSGVYSALNIDDGRIYEVMDWRDDPLSVVIMSSLFLLILTPLCFAGCWAISRYAGPLGGLGGTTAPPVQSRRRVLTISVDGKNQDQHDEENPSTEQSLEQKG